MKLLKEEIAGSGKERLLFAVGRDEMKILLSLLGLSLKNTPRLLETETTIHRMQNMTKALSKGLEMSDRNKFL